MEKIINKTGHHLTITAEKNLGRVREYFRKNKNNSKMECSKALNLSYPTVLKHVKTIEEEV